MDKKFRFTKKTLENLTPPQKGRDTYSDELTPGLKLRVTPNGVKTFTLIKKVKGQTRFIALEEFPVMTVAQARSKAAEITALLAKGEFENKPAVNMTFNELFNRYMDEYAKRFKKTWKEDQRLHDTLLTGLDKKPIQNITKKSAIELHGKLTKNNGPYIANKTLALLRKVFNFAIDNLELDIKNPFVKIKKNREESRERFLNKEELQAFFESLESNETPEQWRDFFLLALWTGARRANIQAMRWEHLDLENGLWQIPGEEFKNSQPFNAVLNKQALEILKRRKEAGDEENAYVFPSRSKTGHVMEPKKAWNKIMKQAGIKNVRIHDLRRTLGSWQAATGASLQVIGKTLGHRNQATTAIYSRLDLDPVRESVNTATAAMLEAMKEKESEE